MSRNVLIRSGFGGLEAACSLFSRCLTVLLLVGPLASGRAATTPTFVNFAAPPPLGEHAGEPSIGVNWNTGNVLMQAGVQTLRVSSFDDATQSAHWQEVGFALTSLTTFDPLLFTDRDTGRTFVSQLAPPCSLMAFTDDDGGSWTPSPIGCGLASGFDHQSIGGGSFAPGLNGLGYPHTVFYVAQAGALANASLSIDGGLTFGPALPMYTLLQCGGLHGHLRSAPDGTIYVPNSTCFIGPGSQGVAVSTDNGLTWSLRMVPGSTTKSGGDPSVAVGSAGTVYFGYGNGDGHPYAAVSHDRGVTWVNNQKVGGEFGIQNCQFPAVIAGDDDRAAFAFLGTTAPGDDQSESFSGVWYLFIAVTYDGGRNWTSVNATPGDPVQRGCIWLGGGANPCRNLLDFMDITVDREGRIIVGYADGCIDGCISSPTNSYSALATIARQSGGTGLFAVYDVPTAPALTLHATRAGNAVVISWPASTIGFVLQSANALSPVNWADVTNPVVVIGSEHTVTNTVSNTNKFFRLRSF